MSKTQLFDLDGKIAFVSGASRGIGAATGVGIGLLPSSVPKYLRPDLCSVPIDGPQWSFSFLLISRQERSRASVRAMFELAEHL